MDWIVKIFFMGFKQKTIRQKYNIFWNFQSTYTNSWNCSCTFLLYIAIHLISVEDLPAPATLYRTKVRHIFPLRHLKASTNFLNTPLDLFLNIVGVFWMWRSSVAIRHTNNELIFSHLNWLRSASPVVLLSTTLSSSMVLLIITLFLRSR